MSTLKRKPKNSRGQAATVEVTRSSSARRERRLLRTPKPEQPSSEVFFIRADMWRQADSGTWSYRAETKYSGIRYVVGSIVGSRRVAAAQLDKACHAIARAIEAMENP